MQHNIKSLSAAQTYTTFFKSKSTLYIARQTTVDS